MAREPATSNQQPATEKNLFHIKVFSPFETFFDAEGYSLTAANETGPFDVLAGHANFLTLLIPCVIKIRAQNGVETNLPIQRGVLHVRGERATVFLNV